MKTLARQLPDNFKPDSFVRAGHERDALFFCHDEISLRNRGVGTTRWTEKSRGSGKRMREHRESKQEGRSGPVSAEDRGRYSRGSRNDERTLPLTLSKHYSGVGKTASQNSAKSGHVVLNRLG